LPKNPLRMFERVAFILSTWLCACAPAAGLTTTTPAEETLGSLCSAAVAAPATDAALRDMLSDSPLPWGAPIRSVALEVPSNLPEELVREVLRSKAGSPLSEHTVEGDVRRLHALSIFEDVAVHARLGLEGLTLVYRLTPRPQIERGFVTGDAGPVLAARYRPRAGELFDAQELTTRRGLILAELRADGYRRARVEHRTLTTSGGGVNVCLKVSRGPRFSITEIAFDGMRAVSRNELLSSMDTRDGLVNTVGRPVLPELFEIDRIRMVSIFYDRGFVTAEIGPPTIEENDDTGEVRIEFTVREGAAFDLGTLQVTGDLIAPRQVYVDLLGLAPGDRFNRRRFVEGIEKIRELHTSMGRPAPDVVPTSELNHTSKTIDISVVVGGS